MIFIIKEHEPLPVVLDPYAWRKDLEDKTLFKWECPLNGGSWRYASYYRIGAEWLTANDALIVKPKAGLESIDWPRMFLSCFETEESCETGLGHIYCVDATGTVIRDKTLQNVITPMIVIHFLSSLSRIVDKGLKCGPIWREKNLRKIKGRIRFVQNLRRNLIAGRADRIFCRYEERSVDIPENQLLKQALIVSGRIIHRMKMHGFENFSEIDRRLFKCETAFEPIADVGAIRTNLRFKQNKLYKEYGAALRLAQLILKMCDNVVDRENGELRGVPPFWLDMSLLYEHYVLGLLRKAYGRKILYQASVTTGYPDFLFVDTNRPQILDTKYKPRYESGSPCVDDIRQLSGYARDRTVLRKLGIHNNEQQDASVVPCVIVFPGADGMPPGCLRFDAARTPRDQLNGITIVPGLVNFHLLQIDLPRVLSNGVKS